MIEIKFISFVLGIMLIFLVVKLVEQQNKAMEMINMLIELNTLKRAQIEALKKGVTFLIIKQGSDGNFVFLDLEGVEKL